MFTSTSPPFFNILDRMSTSSTFLTLKLMELIGLLIKSSKEITFLRKIVRLARKYFYSDPSVVTSPSKMINMPSNEVKFTMSNDDLSKLKRAASAIGAPDMVLEKNGSGTFLTAKNAKNDTANTYSTDIEVDSEGTYKFYFKVENLKLMDGSYDVAISSKNISHFKNKSSDVEYWIALEPESTYSV